MQGSGDQDELIVLRLGAVDQRSERRHRIALGRLGLAAVEHVRPVHRQASIGQTAAELGHWSALVQSDEGDRHGHRPGLRATPAVPQLGAERSGKRD